jgi:hypothetical protein
VSNTGQAYCGVHPSTPLADSPTRRRGKKSLLIRRDATLGISDALQQAIFEQPGKLAFFRNLLSQKPTFTKNVGDNGV